MQFVASTELKHYIRTAAPSHGSFIARPLTPYGDVETERAFRRWHLAIHAWLDAGSDDAGELAVARMHEAEMRAAGLAERDIQAVFFDTWGGFIYSQHHSGEFPVDPAAFIATCFTRGFSAAIHEDFSYGHVQHADRSQNREIPRKIAGAGAIRGGQTPGIRSGETPGGANSEDWAL